MADELPPQARDLRRQHRVDRSRCSAAHRPPLDRIKHGDASLFEAELRRRRPRSTCDAIRDYVTRAIVSRRIPELVAATAVQWFRFSTRQPNHRMANQVPTRSTVHLVMPTDTVTASTGRSRDSEPTPRRETSGFRSLLPQFARERLYAWHPGRARRWRKYPGIERVLARGRAVLTFDDGPDLDATPAVLDALDRAAARATFFVLGEQVQSYPELAREIIQRGHEVALHGHLHERQDRIESRRSEEDMRRGFSVLEEHLGVRCRWYRPPYGKMSPGAARTCRSLGLELVYWSAWGLDWEEADARRIADVASAQLDEGGILLLHDSARHARRASAAPTADAIAIICENARQRGISFGSLGEVVSATEGLAA